MEIDERSAGAKMGFSDSDIEFETETAYCSGCGKPCKVEIYKRPSEDYDPPGSQGKIVKDYRSDCCHDDLRAYRPPFCEMCEEGVGIWYMDKAWMCDKCKREYNGERMSPEEETAKAEWYRDSGAFGAPER